MSLISKRFAVGAPILGLCCAAFTAVAPAHADEPRKVSEPTVLREPAEITQVADAFDDDDPFDLHLSLGYEASWSAATIRRETSITQPGLSQGGFTQANMNAAQYKQTTSRLLTRADIGLYKDVALVVRVPIILSDDRSLGGVAGSEGQQSVVLAGAPGEQLFSLPFKSPTRSGIEYLAVGIDAAIMNQMRDLTKPTWVIGIEGRFNVSEPMHACNTNTGGLNQAGGQVQCAYPSDINRNGKSGEYPNADAGSLEGNFSGSRSPGVSRGTTALEAHTYLSRRIKYIEPYGGFRALFEFPNDSSDYGATNLQGSLVNHPPLRGTLLLGLNVIPWEIPEQFQRITIDFRFTGTYVSEGRDYSELFDALGSSDAPSLRTPNFAEFQKNNESCQTALVNGMCPNPPPGSVVNPQSQKVYFTGLTDVQQHGEYMLSTEFTWQAGEYIKFHLGGGYQINQSHFITFDQACNPDFTSDVNKSGPCHSGGGATSTSAVSATGIPNPNYRRTINDPGYRFKVDDSHAFNAWVNATVMF
ncbi:MAG TPA: hypothetical protein VHV51_12085 [Polyangiaceae bacterium]|jgi:hypothetical protein|nr:hypothetical protein [Polyangiaceae bacterium]